MTTIAYKDGIMAGDGQCTWSGTKICKTDKKVFEINLGKRTTLIGMAGDVSHCYEFLDWFKKGAVLEQKPKFEEDFEDFIALVVKDPGTEKEAIVTYMQNSSYPCNVDIPYFAIGSGTEYALGAMYAGASAIEAVECAIMLDVNTGGEITHVGKEK